MSSFRKIERDEKRTVDGIISLDKDRDQIITQSRVKYRRFDNISQEHIYHMLFDLKPLRKVHYNDKWYCEIHPHTCLCNCPDSKQSLKEWLTLLRSLDDTDWRKKRIARLMEMYGYTNYPTAGMIKIG